MVMDHIHYFFGFTGQIPEWFSMVGRLGAPLFLFCLVEGFTHTHNRKRYFAKVYIISVIMSALLFFMAYGGVFVRPDGFSIYQILPQLIELWGLNVQTEVEARKNLAKVSG